MYLFYERGKKLCNTEKQRPQGPQWHPAKKTRFQETVTWSSSVANPARVWGGYWLIAPLKILKFYNIMFKQPYTTLIPIRQKRINPWQKKKLKSYEKLIKLGINFGLLRPTVKQCVFQQLLQIILRNKLQANWVV